MLPAGFFWSELIQTVVAEYQSGAELPVIDVIPVQPRCVVEIARGRVTLAWVNSKTVSVVVHDPDSHAQADEGAAADQLDAAMTAIERGTNSVAFINAQDLTLGLDPRQVCARAMAVQQGPTILAFTIEDGSVQNAYTNSATLQVIVHDHDAANFKWGSQEASRLLSLAKQGCVKTDLNDSIDFFLDQQASSDDPQQSPA